ncbi:MAG: HAMP domain-containing protein [Lewinellaceae bacterium]|nr:HAMP domain-containing protein [Lewinellaceae bacterium]
MPRSTQTALILLVLLAATTFLVRVFSSENRQLERYAHKVERFLQERETEAADLLSQTPFSPEFIPQGPILQDFWGQAPYSIGWYSGDSLLFSLNSRYTPAESGPPTGVGEDGSPFFLLTEGPTTFVGKWIEAEKGTSPRIILWLPLWEHYELESPYLKSGFFGLQGIPEGVFPAVSPGDVAIRSESGTPILYLEARHPFRDPATSRILFWLALGIGALIAFLINQFAQRLSMRYSPWWGLLTLVVFAAVSRFLLNPFLAPGAEGGLLPDVLLEPIQQQTLAGLLLNTFFLLWVMVFFHQEFEELGFPKLPRSLQVLFSAVNYLAILLAMLLIVQTVRNIVLYSSLNVYLENLFSINTGGALAIGALIFLFLSFFLFSQRMGKVIVSMGLRPVQRILIAILSLAAVTPFYFWADVPFPLEIFLLAGVVYLVGLDWFSDTESPSLTWVFGWLLLFSVLTTMLLSSFHLEKEDKIQQDLVLRLTSSEMETNAPDLSQAISGSTFQSIFLENDIPEELDYALYHQGTLVKKSALSNFPFEEKALSIQAAFDTLTPRDTPDRIEWCYRNSNGNTAITSRRAPSFMGPVSVFSYLLALFILIILLLAILNYWLRFLPYSLDFTQLQRPTLSNRIQLWVIGFLLIAFIFLGFFSVWNFRQTANYNQDVQIKEKIDGIREDAYTRIRQADKLLTGRPLWDLLEAVARSHQMDMLIYEPDGRFAGSTLPPSLEKVLAPSRLNSATHYFLATGRKLFDLQGEKIGDLPFRTAYLPIAENSGTALAYIGLPFVNQASNWQEELSGFFSGLISAYVFLLLVTSAVAIFIANSITQPISQIGESLRRLKLGKNEPLTYSRQDELGVLIEEYNRTLEKLEDSTRKLAESERDSAWREMARQVAHEIKNPLTPMQLAIQQLQYALATQPEKATQMFGKVSKTIVEEIQNLKDIAESFSNFAKMPIPENSTFSINELVENVHTLFMHGEEDFDVSLQMPEEDVQVFADRNHLRRVFTNIFKNAIQAFTSERRGRIDTRVFLRDGFVVVQISDNGSGIPEELREKVFVPNFTTKSSGSGLGMAIAKKIIELAGGRIYFETESGRGTDFFVELPVVE